MQTPPPWTKALAQHPWYRPVVVVSLLEDRSGGEEWGERGYRGISPSNVCISDRSNDVSIVIMVSIFHVRYTRHRA